MCIKNAGFTRTAAQRQFSISRSEIKLHGQGMTGSCREYTHLCDEYKMLPEGDYWQQHQNWTCSGRNRRGVEIKIDAFAKEESQSWVVISTSVEGYITELSLDCTKRIRVDTDVLSTGRLAEFVQWNALEGTSPSSPHDDVHQVLTKLATHCYPVSPIMSHLSRYYDTFREVQGAVAWGKAAHLIRRVTC